MDYSPRQLQAFVFLASRRRRRELREQLHVAALAARGDPDAVQRMLRDLDNG
jgi:hypothetical protein